MDENKKLYLFSDAPHGFKNLTQSLLNNDQISLPDHFVRKYQLPWNLVERDHLEDLFSIQNNVPLKLAPKFNETNLYPQGFQKMRVATSSNLMHIDVSSALNYLSLENEEYKTTAKFISYVERWFSIVTSRNILLALSKRNEVKYKETVEFLEECLNLFKDMKIGSQGYWKPCQTALILTTQSVLSIHLELIDTWNFEFVLMGRFTQDCVENFFSSVRANSPRTTALNHSRLR